jgi:transcriptional regulator with XRE-family HTH domain
MNLKKSILIALIRAEKNQTWLAQRLGIDHQTVSRWCRSGKMNTENLCKVAEALDIKVSELIKLGEDTDKDSVSKEGLKKAKEIIGRT